MVITTMDKTVDLTSLYFALVSLNLINSLPVDFAQAIPIDHHDECEDLRRGQLALRI